MPKVAKQPLLWNIQHEVSGELMLGCSVSTKAEAETYLTSYYQKNRRNPIALTHILHMTVVETNVVVPSWMPNELVALGDYFSE